MGKIFIYGIIVFIILILVICGINQYVKLITRNLIITEKDAIKLSNVDCIIVLGAGVRNDKPSDMLKDRLDEAIYLYKIGTCKKIIMSGDHGRSDYDEVNIMKQYAIDEGVLSEDIFMDHAGFSSYETMYRAKEIFGVNRIIIVTQKYHLYRSIYIAKKLGLDANGVGADPRRYVGETYREAREILARNKDFLKCIFKPNPTYLGEKIDINGDGNITNDK